VILIASVLLVIYAITTRPTETLDYLRSSGYASPKLTGYALLVCDKGEVNRDGFSALSADGTPVTGVVCSRAFGKKPRIVSTH